MSIQLRPYQEKLTNEIRSKFAEKFKAVLCVLATGGGKTIIFSYICDGAYRKGLTVGILVHRSYLLRQTSRALEQFGIKHGCVAPGYTQTKDKVQIMSVLTALKRLTKLPKFDLIIIDECHHAVAKCWMAIFAFFTGAKLLGVTATPCRMNGEGLGAVFDSIVVGAGNKELMDEGFLTEALVFQPPVKVSLKNLKMRGGDYATKELNERIDKPTITGDAVEHYRKICPGKSAIYYCASVDHSHHVAEQFNRAGFKFEVLHGGADCKVEEILGKLERGEINGVTSCDLVSEGLDIPSVAVCGLLRPTQSLALYLQQIGRALRPVYAPGFDLTTREGRMAAIEASSKPKTIILDHVGNTFASRHGFPDDVREWSLAGRAPRQKKNQEEKSSFRIIHCPAPCFAAYRVAKCCPYCKRPYIVEGREIKVKSGELILQEREAKKSHREFTYRELVDCTKNFKTLKQFKQEAEEKGYQPGWAFYRMKDQTNRINYLQRLLAKYDEEMKEPVLGGEEINTGEKNG